MKSTTLLFLVKKDNSGIKSICLAMKKRGFGQGRWNGVGGKVEDGESVESAAMREAQEEIGVTTSDLKKVAELSFTFPHNEGWSQLVHVYFSDKWSGEPTESDEMKPQWYSIDTIPFKDMWPDDPFWLPRVIEGELLRASFTFGEGDVILNNDVQSVASL